MKKLFSLLIFFIAFSINAQIITNVDKLRIRDVERGLDSDKILVIDSGNVVRWTDAIEIDLSDYYTISEVDAFVADLEAELLERYTKDEVDALLDGLELRLDDYYTKTEVDSIITNINDRIDNIDLNTVTSVDNVTSIKIRGSDIFTNNLETDFAQIADVNKAGFGLISMQSEMKIGLVAKDGTTLLDDVDVSWLASGDLAVTIDDTDPNNPELVFSQNGVEVARIPASTLLSGVARSANLSNYILQFKDGTGAVVYSVNLEPLFEDYFTKADADARYARRTRTISAGNGLTGGGNLTANRTIGLSTDTQEDVAKGVEAHGWGDFREFGLGVAGSVVDIQDITSPEVVKGRLFRSFQPEHMGAILSMPYSGGVTSLRAGLIRNTIDGKLFFSFVEEGIAPVWREVWHDGNLTAGTTAEITTGNTNNRIWSGAALKSKFDNYYTKTQSDSNFVTLSGVQTIFETKTFESSPVVPNPTLDAHAVNRGWVENEINGVQGQVETFLVGSTGGRLSLGMSTYHILGKKIDIISMGGTITAPQDLNQILSGDLSIEIDQIPGMSSLALSSVTLNRFVIGNVYREDVRADGATHNYTFIELRQGTVTGNPLTSSIFTTGVKNINIKFHVSGIIIENEQ